MSDCLVCEGQKWLVDERGVATRCTSCNVVDLLRATGIPPSERRWTVDALEPYLAKLAIRAIELAMRKPPGSCLLQGANGRGKTCVAVAAVQELVGRGMEAKYVFVPDWLSELRDGYRRGTQEHTLLHPLMSHDMLLLDDLGQEHTTPWVCSLVTRLVRHRQVNELSTIITTNLPLTERAGIAGLRETYGSTLASRLKDYERLVIPAEAPDLRGQKE